MLSLTNITPHDEGREGRRARKERASVREKRRIRKRENREGKRVLKRGDEKLFFIRFEGRKLFFRRGEARQVGRLRAGYEEGRGY